MPGLGEVPEIDVPVYLPDLPGVVDDEIYRYIIYYRQILPLPLFRFIKYTSNCFTN